MGIEAILLLYYFVCRDGGLEGELKLGSEGVAFSYG